LHNEDGGEGDVHHRGRGDRKVGPLRELIELVQQNAAAAMATPSVLPPLRLRRPDPSYLGWLLLAGQVAAKALTVVEEAALKVHREEVMKKARKKAKGKRQLKFDRMAAGEKAAFTTKANEKRGAVDQRERDRKQLVRDNRTAEETGAFNQRERERK
jgi:hypothetical protein